MNKLLAAAIAIVVVGAISVFAVSPYFTESTIDEAIPTGAIVQSQMESKDIITIKDVMEDDTMMEEEKMMDDTMEEEKMMDDTMEEEKMMDDTMEEEKMMDDTMEEEKMMDDTMEEEKMMDDTMEEEKMMDDTMEEEKMMDDTMEEEKMMDDTMEEEKMMDDTMEEEKMMDDTMEESMPMSFAGKFIGVGDGVHDAQGDAYTIPLEDNSNVLRLENFKSTNGPDLYVYLSTDDNASEFVNLGKLKASSGNQNYEIPEDTDLSKYNKVLVWCKAFGVLFGSAELSSK